MFTNKSGFTAFQPPSPVHNVTTITLNGPCRILKYNNFFSVSFSYHYMAQWICARERFLKKTIKNFKQTTLIHILAFAAKEYGPFRVCTLIVVVTQYFMVTQYFKHLIILGYKFSIRVNSQQSFTKLR